MGGTERGDGALNFGPGVTNQGDGNGNVAGNASHAPRTEPRRTNAARQGLTAGELPRYEALVRRVEAAPDGGLSGGLSVQGLASGAWPEATVGVVADLDGDHVDEVLTSVVPVLGAGLGPRSAKVWRPDQSGLVVSHTVFLPEAWVALGAVDLDGDGAVDLVGSERARSVAWGQEHGRFDTPRALEDRPGDTAGFGGFALDDFDEDGWLDVIAVHDDCMPGDAMALCCETCATVVPLLRDGPRSFTAHPELIAQPSRLTGVAVHSTRAGTGEPLLVALAWRRQDQYEQVFFRRSSIEPDGWPRWRAFDPFPVGSEALDGHEAPDPMASISAWSPMGAATADVDNDGLQDLVLALEPRLALFAGARTWPFVDLTADANLADRRRLSRDAHFDTPWGVAMVDLDLDEDPDLVAANGLDPSAPSATVFQQSVSVSLNDGSGHFTVVPDALGMHREGQWRALTLADLGRDGTPDFIVGGLGELPQVYRSRPSSSLHGLSLRLHGTLSNHYGVGATIEVWSHGETTPQTFVMGAPAGPYVVSEPIVFVGLGAATTTDNVRVTWPSGYVQETSGLRAGASYTLTEPELLTVSPPSRSLPSSAPATLVYTPRDSAGRLANVSRVSASVTGTTDASCTVTQDGPRWVLTLRASRPGSAVVTVTADGVSLGVRPRVWFH